MTEPAAPYEKQFPYGLYARPVAAPPSTPSALYALKGGTDHAFLPDLQPGETTVYPAPPKKADR